MTDRPRVLAVGLRITRRKQGEAVVLELAGRLDASLDRHLLHALEALTEAGERRIVLDLGGLEYLGSRGVSAFIAVIDDLRAQGGDLKLAGVTRQAGWVLDRLGVSKLLQRFATAGEAAAAFWDAETPRFAMTKSWLVSVWFCGAPACQQCSQKPSR